MLNSINLDIEPKKFYVIVRVNGTGKTTFINLLCRLYDPCEGEILFGDTNIKRFNYREYRAMFGVVFQNYKIYDYSITENIAMDAYNGSDEVNDRVYDCITKTGLKDKVDSLPNGIKTPLGRAFDDNGVNLSGGES